MKLIKIKNKRNLKAGSWLFNLKVQKFHTNINKTPAMPKNINESSNDE